MNKDHMERTKLLHYINMISFAVNDVTLYLDTHPCDDEAIEYFNQCNHLRNKALNEYAEKFEPLTISTTRPDHSWDWNERPWPWEGGRC